MDLISRQAAIDAIESHMRSAEEPYYLQDVDRTMNYAFEIAASCIYNLPSAQPERKKGRWIPLHLSMANPPYQCSCCFRNAPMVETGCLMNRHLEALLTDFCPNCGADMEGEEDEQ